MARVGEICGCYIPPTIHSLSPFVSVAFCGSIPPSPRSPCLRGVFQLRGGLSVSLSVAAGDERSDPLAADGALDVVRLL